MYIYSRYNIYTNTVKQAISLSGSPNISYPGVKAQHVSRPLVEALNCSTVPQDDAKGLECMLNKTWQELLAVADTPCLGVNNCFGGNCLLLNFWSSRRATLTHASTLK